MSKYSSMSPAQLAGTLRIVGKLMSDKKSNGEPEMIFYNAADVIDRLVSQVCGESRTPAEDLRGAISAIAMTAASDMDNYLATVEEPDRRDYAAMLAFGMECKIKCAEFVEKAIAKALALQEKR